MLKNRNFYLFIGTIGILITGFLMTFGLQNALDIVFLDETSYLVRGSKMFAKIPKRWGPIYCAWYRILMFVENDLVNLYYLNYKLMAMIPSALLFLMLNRYSKSILLSFLIALCFLVSVFNLPIYPRISFFVISIIFVALIISSYLKDNFLKGLLFVSMALILSYARPEFYLTIILLLFVLIGMFVFKQVKFKKQYITPIIVFLVGAIILHLGLGNPLLVKLHGMNRSIIAFGEHFAYNYSVWTGSELYEWLAWHDLFVEQFGDVNSLTAAMQNNFPMFWKHVWSNIVEFIFAATNLFSSLLLPFKLNRTLSLIFGLLVFAAVVWSFIKNFKKVATIEMLFLFVFAIPTFISCILVYPRNHYLVLVVPFISLILVRAFHFVKEQEQTIKLTGIVTLTVLLCAFGPKASDFTYFRFAKDEGVLNNQMTLELFKNIEFPQQLRMITNEGDLASFIDNDIEFIIPKEKRGVDFNTFLEVQNPDIFYVTQIMLNNPYFAKDPAFQTFLNDYESKGYKKKLLDDDIREYFLVKEDFSKYFDQ